MPAFTKWSVRGHKPNGHFPSLPNSWGTGWAQSGHGLGTTGQKRQSPHVAGFAKSLSDLKIFGCGVRI